MPYDIFGNGITQEELVKNEVRYARRRRHARMGNFFATMLIASIVGMGIISIITGIGTLIMSEDLWLSLLGVALAVTAGSMTLLALLWARFDV